MTHTERLALASEHFVKANNLRVLLRVNHETYLFLCRAGIAPEVAKRLDADLLALRKEIDEAEAMADSFFNHSL
jgi:hypothetical protein